MVAGIAEAGLVGPVRCVGLVGLVGPLGLAVDLAVRPVLEREPIVAGRAATPRRVHGAPRNLHLIQPGAAGERLDGVPVEVSRREVHVRKPGTRPEDLVHQAEALHELRPVERGDQAHARDHVSDGHVHTGLPLVLPADGLLGRRALLREELVQPAEHGHGGRVLVAQALEELDPPGRRK